MSKQSAFLIVIFCSTVLSFPWIGERQFYTRGEPREALVPLKMLESSNWILPRTFDDRIPSKPPFTHWLIGLTAEGVASITGENARVSEWSARFPAALLSLLFIGVFFVWVARALGTERGFHSALILLTSIEWLRGLVTARVDTILSVLLGLALCGLFSLAKKKSVLMLFLTIVALAAATLTKGPVALVLPGLVIGLFIWGEKRRFLPSVQIGSAVFLPALIIASFWYLLAYQEAGGDFLNKFWYENVQRFASSTDDSPHDHSIAYLAFMFFVGLLPWSLFYFAVGASLFQRARQQGLIRWRALGDLIRGRSFLYSSLANWYRGLAPIERYSLIIVLAFFSFFAIPSSKRGVYLLPAFPFAALLLSRVSCRMLAEGADKYLAFKRVAFLVTSLLPIILFALVFLLPLVLVSDGAVVHLLRFEQRVFLSDLSAWLATIFVVGASFYGYRLLRNGRLKFVHLVVWLVSVMAFFQGPVVTGFAAAVSEKHLAEQLKRFPATLPLYSYYYEYYGTIFYLNRTISLVGWDSSRHGLILVKERDYEQFKAQLPEGYWQVVRTKSSESVVKLGNIVLVIEFGDSNHSPE